MHAWAPGASLYLSATQELHTGPSAAWPVLHTQPVAPVCVCWLSAHAVQFCGPGSALYVPGAHGTQRDSPSLPEDPASQVHADAYEAPALEVDFPGTQLVHAADAFAALYLPRAQGRHAAPPSAPVDPASQAHAESEMAPTVVEDLPAGQEVHCTAPGDDAYLLCPRSSV